MITAEDENGNTSTIHSKEIPLNSFVDTADLSGGSFVVLGTEADITAPKMILSTLTISKKEVDSGETVSLSLEINDQSKLKSVEVVYQKPQTENWMKVFLTYNEETKRYEKDIAVEESFETGTYKIKMITAEDENGNTSTIHSKEIPLNSFVDTADLSGGSFMVLGTEADITAPEMILSTLTISKKEVDSGETVSLSLQVNDQSKLKQVEVVYQKPQTENWMKVFLTYNRETNRYEKDIAVEESFETGTYKIKMITAEDENGNISTIHSKEIPLNSFVDMADLSSGNFTLVENETLDEYQNISTLENQQIFTYNQTISNTTINGDVYIGPKAVVTFNNVTVTGSIYVLGALRANSVSVAGSISANSFSWGGNPTLYNGTVILTGSNSISSMKASNTPVTDMPLRLDSKARQ